MPHYLTLLLLLAAFPALAQPDTSYDGVYKDAEGLTGFEVIALSSNENGKCLEVHHDIYDNAGVTVYSEAVFADCADKKGQFRAPFESGTLSLSFSTDKENKKHLTIYENGTQIATMELDPNHQTILSDIDMMYYDEEDVSGDWDEDFALGDEDTPLYKTNEGAELYFQTREHFAVFNLYGLLNEFCEENSLGDMVEFTDKARNTYDYKVDDCLTISFKVENDRITVTEIACSELLHTGSCPGFDGVYVKQP